MKCSMCGRESGIKLYVVFSNGAGKTVCADCKERHECENCELRLEAAVPARGYTHIVREVDGGVKVCHEENENHIDAIFSGPRSAYFALRHATLLNAINGKRVGRRPLFQNERRTT